MTRQLSAPGPGDKKYLKQKRSPPVNNLIGFSFLFLFCLNAGPVLTAQIPDVREDLTYLNRLNVNDQVYLHTDCEVYSPGDTIWFKAYIRRKYDLKKSSLSSVFNINLVNEQEEIIVHESYLITDSQSSGYLVIDNERPDGYHTLYCYTSWMENFNPESIYRKKILILRDINRGERIIPHFNKAGYSPGDTVRVVVKNYDDLNNQMEGSRFRYRLMVGKDVVVRGGAHSTATESNPLELIIPDSLTETPRLEIWDNTREEAFDIPVNTDIHVDFFPEGGNCLMDIPGIMAFKAVYSNGSPVTLSGLVIDDEGDVLSEVNTVHDGLGQFLYQPLENKTYYLKITSPPVAEKIFNLPAARKNAWTIHANSIQNRLHVEIKTNRPDFDTCLFVLSMRGFSDYFRLIRSESESAFILPTDKFPAGIAVLTLLDRNWIPLAERLVFINHDKFILPDLKTNRKKYLCRDSVLLGIDLGIDNPMLNEGQYSLTVFDDRSGSSALIDEPEIISSYYLRPEIKGEIRNPNYYFSADNQETRYHLDLLLLTQGWRTYRYEVLSEPLDSANLPINRDYITGNVKRFRYGRDPLPVEADLKVYFSGNWVSFNTDETGNFSILPEYSADNLSPVIITARDNKGSDKVIIEMEEDSFQNRLHDYLAALSDSTVYIKQDNAYLFEDIKRTLNINTSQSIWIEEVKIVRNIRPDTVDIGEELIKSLYNVHAANETVLSTANDLYEVVLSMGVNCNLDVQNDRLLVYFQGTYEPVRFIIDGFDMGEIYSDINSMYRPNEIESLYMARGYDAFVMYRNNVVIYIKPDYGAIYNNPGNEMIRNFIMIPILKVNKEFYSPEYRTEAERNFPVPDIRKTIYWNPDIQVDMEGRAGVVFFNSDRYTRVKCILEGITDTGIPVHGETSYDITIYRE